MKILHFGKYYPPYFGGVEKVNYDLVEKLNQKDGCVVDELCFCHSVDYRETFKPMGYRVFRIPIWGVKFSTPIPKGIMRAFWQIRKNYDLVHVHVPNPIASIVSLLLPRKTKIVVHWHSDIVKQKLLLAFFHPFQNAFLKRANAIIVTSRNYIDGSCDLKSYRSKVEVVPIGLDMAEMVYRQEDVESIKKNYEGKKIVLCIGRLTYYKGHKYLIEAAKLLTDDAVVVVGGVGELEQELKAYSHECDVEDRVKFIGRIPQDLIYAYYKAADVFCLPSITKAEAFGVVLVESLAMGTPIVTCNIEGSGVPWVNQDGVTGYNVTPENPQELAEKINLILCNGELRSQFSANCTKRYRELFTLDKMVDATYRLYQRLMS